MKSHERSFLFHYFFAVATASREAQKDGDEHHSFQIRILFCFFDAVSSFGKISIYEFPLPFGSQVSRD